MILSAHIMRDQFYSVKMDEIDRIVILKQDGMIKTTVCEALEKKNKVNIAKLAWFSRKNNGKVYESMVVYLTKSANARMLL